MDRGQFDALARLVGAKQSRRTALATALGATLLGQSAPVAAAKGKKNKGKRPCFAGRTCIPGPGKDNAGCDFSFSTKLHRRNAQGAHLGDTNLTGAHLVGADLRGADLGGACLAGADLRDARIDGSTDLRGATFCETFMPDGSINNRDCARPTRCCPTTLSKLPGFGDRGVAFQSIKNNTRDRSFNLDVFYYPRGFHDQFWQLYVNRPLQPGEDYKYVNIFRDAALYFDQKYWVYARNLPIYAPLGQVGFGGEIKNRDWRGWTIVQDKEMTRTGDQISMFRDNVLLVLRKVDDDSNNINFAVEIQTLSGDPD